jgi:glyoxylate reductase
MPNILVTRPLPAAVIGRLEEAGTVEVYADGAMPADLLRQRLADKDALVAVITDEVSPALIDAAPNLKVVSNIAVGFNNIDIGYARARGVVVTNTPDVLTESVADFTLGMILGITRRMAEGDRLIRRHGWKGFALDFMLGSDLTGKQLGLVGFGRIARAVAKRASVFAMRVAYADVAEADGPFERLSLDRLLNSSDVVSLHVPLTAETRHLIDKRALTRMKRTAYLVNTSRGPVVDEAALAWALSERLIAGAALDVYEQEPAVHPDLLALENVLLVPHLGSATTETRTAMANLAANNVVAVLGGRPPLTPVLA